MAHWQSPTVPHTVAWRLQAGAWMLSMHPERPRSGALPVIALHGWPQSATRSTHLAGFLVHPSNLAGMLASGHTVYCPFTGSNWGAPTDLAGLGAGNNGIDAAITVATADGHDTSRVHLFGTSMGGCNALNWAWRNPTKIAGVYVIAPSVDLTATGSVLSAIGDSIDAAHPDGYDDFDPVQNVAEVAAIADHISAFGDRSDELVPWSGLEAFAATAGFPLEASTPVGVPGGGHFFMRQFWSDLAPARHFRAVEADGPLFIGEWSGSDGDPWPSEWSTALNTASINQDGAGGGRITPGSSANNHYGYAWPAALSLADVDATTVIHAGGLAVEGIQPRLVVRWAGGMSGHNPTSCYIAYFRPPTNNMPTFGRLNATGSFSQIGSSVTGLTLTDPVAMRIQAVGTTVRFKAWNASDPEPGSWHVETTDTNHAGPGRVAVGAIRPSTSSSGMTVTSFAVDTP